MHATSNDDYCIASRGTKVRKMHSTRRDAFRPINELPLAKIWPDGKIEKINEKIRAREQKDDAKAHAGFESKVAILRAYPSSDPEIIGYYVQKKYLGLIIEGTALGHVPTATIDPKDSWISQVKSAVEGGLYVGMTGQCIYGKVNPYVYTNLRRLAATGAQHLDDMLTEVAYVKLGWVLAQTKSVEEIRKMMAQDIAGEYGERHNYSERFMY